MRSRRPSLASSDPMNRRHRPDYWLLVIGAVLLVIGLIVVYSISPALSVQSNVNQNYFVNKQLLAIGLGLVVFAIITNLPYKLWRKLQLPLIVGAAIATLIALVLPVSPDYPAHRWIRLGGLSLQSVEIIKFALLICVAAWLADAIKNKTIQNSSKIFKILIIVLGSIGLIVAVLQKDLGSAGVMVAMMAAMCFIAGLPMKKVLLFGGIIAIGTVLAISTSGYRRARLFTFLHPTQDCQTSGYQSCEALIAVGSGGVFGKGIAHSVQDYGYLPEAANDSIFAILAEKFGFIGVCALLGLFIALFTRLKNIMEQAPDNFSRLLVAGILAWLSTQTIINIGAMIGLLPLKGITLPFISYGGTSVLFVTGLIGLAFQISRYTTYGVNSSIQKIEGTSYDSDVSRRRDERPHYPTFGRRS